MKKILRFISYISFFSLLLTQGQIFSDEKNSLSLKASQEEEFNVALNNLEEREMEIYEILARGGYWLYYPARLAGHSFERVTRPFKYGEVGYEETLTAEILQRVSSCFITVIATPTAILTFPVASIFLTTAHLLHSDRLQFEEGEAPSVSGDFSVLFLNVCLQGGPFSALTGGVSSLHEDFDKCQPSRISAIADFVQSIEGGPDILCFSEVHDLAAMDELKIKLKEKGYTFFITDIPTHPVCNNSGLFVASKVKISNPQFAAYPLKDRSNVHLGAQQGCIIFDLEDESAQKVITLASTHLNYGERDIDHESRKRQLHDHIFENLSQEDISLLGGDLNYEYFNKMDELQSLAEDREVASLLDCDVVTTTRESFETGPHIRGKQKPKEVIDAALLLNDDSQYQWDAQTIEPKLGDKFVTDHYGVLVRAQKK